MGKLFGALLDEQHLPLHHPRAGFDDRAGEYVPRWQGSGAEAFRLISLISRRCGRVHFGGRPPSDFRYSELNPSALKLRITSRTRSSCP